MSDAILLDEVDSGIEQDGQPVLVPFHAAIELHSPLRLDQFTAELGTAAGVSITLLTLQASGDPAIASAEHHVALWTEAEEVQPSLLLSVAGAHVPDQAWHASGPTSGVTLDDLRDKARQGVMLAADELQLAVQFLLLAGE